MPKANAGYTQIIVAVVPKMLNSLREIADEFGRGEDTVRKWHKAGAPITCEGTGTTVRYSTEVNALQAWRVSRK